MVPVSIQLVASDDCVAPELLLVSCEVSSDEPDDADGDGNITGDVDGEDGYTVPGAIDLVYNPESHVFENTLWLRAERDGTESGRKYSIFGQVEDLSGNVSTVTCVVVVPHDKRKKG